MSSRYSTNSMFAIFTNLPSELRFKIWQQACVPRIVTLTYNTSSSSFTSTTSPPPLLAVNKESRREARRIYTLSFGTSSSPSNAQTYFNPLLDTLYIPRCQEMGYDESLRDFRTLVHDPTNLLDEIRCVAIDHVNVEVKRPWESYNKAVLIRSFPHLDEIKLILNPDGTGFGDNTPSPHSQTSSTLLEHNQQVVSRQKTITFEDLSINPEKLLNIWYYFRQSFMMEERMLGDVCRDSGMEYEGFELPTVRLLAKIIGGNPTAREEDEMGMGRKGEHMRAALDMMRS